MRLGQRVAPDTLIGEDFESGETRTAGCHGEIAAVSFRGGEHALVVVVVADAHEGNAA